MFSDFQYCCRPGGFIGSSSCWSATYGIGWTKSTAGRICSRSGRSASRPCSTLPKWATTIPNAGRPRSSGGTKSSGGAVMPTSAPPISSGADSMKSRQ